MKARGIRSDMLDGFESDLFRFLKVTAPCSRLGASEIHRLPRKLARLVDGPDLQDICRSQQGICIQYGESHAMGTHIEGKTLNVPTAPQVAQHLNKFLRSRGHVA